LVTAALRNPTTPVVVGAATSATGATAALPAAAISELLPAVVAAKALAAGTAVAMVDAGVTSAAELTTMRELTGVAASTVAECAELESVLTGAVVVECLSSAAVAGSEAVAGGVLTSEALAVSPVAVASAGVVGAAETAVCAAVSELDDV
jgi:hypothetical protein